jgi:hypothetical protein
VSHDRVWFIDLVGVRRHGELGQGRRVRDLARLHVSFLDHPALTRSDRLRFLLGYLFRSEFAKEGWKEWWNAIDRAAHDKVRRNQSRGRVVG